MEENNHNFQDVAVSLQSLRQRLEKLILGQEEVITEALCVLLAQGHILLTGVPGLAKTTLVRVLAHLLGLFCARIQFTPDLLPSDITGSELLNLKNEQSFKFVKGPIFGHMVLADEINRASPRTQSALLEAMQERQVTVNTQTHPLPEPFIVFATQNPLESEGTFPLPEAQLDRFLLHSQIFYPDEEAEFKLLQKRSSGNIPQPADWGEPLKLDLAQCFAAQNQIRIAPGLLRVVNRLVRGTRPGDDFCGEACQTSVEVGAGPRAGLALVSVAQSLALLQGKSWVNWHHLKRLAKPVLRHRLKLKLSYVPDSNTADDLVDSILEGLENQYSAELEEFV